VEGTAYESSPLESLLIEESGNLVRRCDDDVPEAAR
jgi:hypothetical protein